MLRLAATSFGKVALINQISLIFGITPDALGCQNTNSCPEFVASELRYLVSKCL